MKNISITIKKIRNTVGMSQAKFAKELDIKQSVVCRYETGKAFPALETIRKIYKFAKAHKVKVKLEDFLNGDE